MTQAQRRREVVGRFSSDYTAFVLEAPLYDLAWLYDLASLGDMAVIDHEVLLTLRPEKPFDGWHDAMSCGVAMGFVVVDPPFSEGDLMLTLRAQAFGEMGCAWGEARFTVVSMIFAKVEKPDPGKTCMIRSEGEYQDAIRCAQEDKDRLSDLCSRLNVMHLSSEEIDRALGPLRSFFLQLQQEIASWGKL